MHVHLQVLLCLPLVACLVSLTTGQTTEELATTAAAPKIRNVDDPNRDPVEYSQQWLRILSQLESGMNQWQFGARFRAAVAANSVANISAECLSAMRLYFEKPLEQDWTFRMWDSNGHFPSGILAGSLTNFGDYDGCMAISESTIGGHGKYCILELRTPHPIRLVNFTGTKYQQLDEGINYVTSWDHFAGIANGLCLPSVCTDTELEQIVPIVLPSTVRENFRIRTRLCQEPKTAETRSESMRFGQKVAIAIVAVNVLLVLLGTLVAALVPNTSSFTLALLSAFSVWTNSRILFHINKSPRETTASSGHPRRQFKFIHGLRVISIYWVVYAHVFLFHPFLELYDRVSPVQTLLHRKDIASNLLAHFIANGGLAVGTFFIISGALTIYSILPVYKKNPINFFSYVLLRWARFAPPSLGMICFILIWPLFGTGPMFLEEFTSLVTAPCYTNWWVNFLFITNFYSSKEMCNVMTWYLGADFQLHILLYVVIYFFYRRRWLTTLFIGAMFILGFIAPPIIVLLGIAEAPNPSIFLHPSHRFPMDKVGVFIFGTYNHFIPYFAGVILGLLFLRKRPLNISPLTCWALWLTIFPLAMLLPFASMSFSDSTEPVSEPLPSAIIFSIVRCIWAAGMFWLMYECANGRAGPIRRILSADWLQPLSRLSFAVYLAHVIPIWHHYFSLRSPVAISMENFLFIGTANCVYATALAYLLYLLFEAPYVNLMKLLVMPAINGKRTGSNSTMDGNNNADGAVNQSNGKGKNSSTHLALSTVSTTGQSQD